MQTVFLRIGERIITMAVNLGTETPTVQDPLIKYAGEIKWGIVSREDALTLRKGESGTLFYRILEDGLIKLNKGLVSRKNVSEIISDIEAVKNNIEGNAEILGWLRGEQSIYDQRRILRDITGSGLNFQGILRGQVSTFNTNVKC